MMLSNDKERGIAMNLLLIYTHPNHQSLSHAFLQKVVQGSQENPRITEITVLDLYEEGFDPVLVFNQNKRRRDMHSDPRLEKYR
jgi:NAD(P)H dehydrogenase (quinone)